VALALAAIVIAPWIWRNRVAYGHASFFASTNRNLVMYKNMHDPLDHSTPTLARVDELLGYDHVDFEWLWRLSLRMPPAEAEALARQILDENTARRPWQRLAQIGESGVAFAGFLGDQQNDRTAVRYWFRALVRNVPQMSRLGYQEGASALEGWVFVPKHRNTTATRLLASAGERYLCPGRAILSLALVTALGLYVVWLGRSREPAGPRRAGLVAILAAGYLATLGTHAVMLMDYDRYASMFDFVIVLIIALIADEAIAALRAKPATRF
jgi:hypothetical protein